MATDAEIVQRILEQPKSSQIILDLPCGYLDETGTLHKDVVVREMTGYEEDMLAARNVPMLKKQNELLNRCVVRIGTILEPARIIQAVQDMVVGDRVFLMFAIRRATLGDEFPFNEKCEQCGETSLLTLDLSTLDVRSSIDPTKRVFDAVLPSGKALRYHPLTGKDESRVREMLTTAGNDAVSTAIMLRIELLDGVLPTLQAVKELGMRDREFMRNDLFASVEGGVDTTVEVTCPKCNYEFSRDIEVSDTGFFSPSVLRKTLRKKSSG